MWNSRPIVALRQRTPFVAILPIFYAMKLLLAWDRWTDGEPWSAAWRSAGENIKH